MGMYNIVLLRKNQFGVEEKKRPFPRKCWTSSSISNMNDSQLCPRRRLICQVIRCHLTRASARVTGRFEIHTKSTFKVANLKKIERDAIINSLDCALAKDFSFFFFFFPVYFFFSQYQKGESASSRKTLGKIPIPIQSTTEKLYRHTLTHTYIVKPCLCVRLGKLGQPLRHIYTHLMGRQERGEREKHWECLKKKTHRVPFKDGGQSKRAKLTTISTIINQNGRQSSDSSSRLKTPNSQLPVNQNIIVRQTSDDTGPHSRPLSAGYT